VAVHERRVDEEGPQQHRRHQREAPQHWEVPLVEQGDQKGRPRHDRGKPDERRGSAGESVREAREVARRPDSERGGRGEEWGGDSQPARSGPEEDADPIRQRSRPARERRGRDCAHRLRSCGREEAGAVDDEEQQHKPGEREQEKVRAEPGAAAAAREEHQREDREAGGEKEPRQPAEGRACRAGQVAGIAAVQCCERGAGPVPGGEAPGGGGEVEAQRCVPVVAERGEQVAHLRREREDQPGGGHHCDWHPRGGQHRAGIIRLPGADHVFSHVFCCGLRFGDDSGTGSFRPCPHAGRLGRGRPRPAACGS
jgi:hypothetical protein